MPESLRSRKTWRKRSAGHLPEYVAEFLGTAFLVFCVVAAVGWMFAPASGMRDVIPQARPRLFITGLLLGSAGSLVAITPLGRLSGAHLNPAVSLGFFLGGRMHLNDLFGYVLAQMAGAWVGARLAAVSFSQLARGVNDALNQPAAHISALMAFGAETVATFSLTFVIFMMVSRPTWMRWTPLVVIPVVALIVLADGNFSGASLNPARSFGPALVLGVWRDFWVYVAGPCSGSALAALLHRYGARLETETGKLFHDLNYRSIFTGHSDHLANAHLRASGGATDSHLRLRKSESRPTNRPI